MKITDKQIFLILEGIEDGLTIEQCFKYILRVDRGCFYSSVTPEQLDVIKTHKFLYSSSHASYHRTNIRVRSL